MLQCWHILHSVRFFWECSQSKPSFWNLLPIPNTILHFVALFSAFQSPFRVILNFFNYEGQSIGRFGHSQ